MYQGSPRNLSLHMHEDDTCSMTPCEAIQGRRSAVFLKSLSEHIVVSNGIPLLSCKGATPGTRRKNDTTKVTLDLLDHL